MNLEQFKSQFKDVAVTNKFKVTVSNGQKYFGDMGRFGCTFFAKGAVLPSQKLNSSGYSYYGLKLNVPSGLNFSLLPVTFFSDSEFKVWNGFSKWFDAIYSKKTLTVDFFDNVKSDVIVDVYNRSMQTIRTITFKDCIPEEVSEVPLNWDLTNQPLEFTVNFLYVTWE